MAEPWRLKFAVVREDPWIETHLVGRFGLRRALVVASGGCTALSLALGECQRVAVEAFDLNPCQLAHVRSKMDAVEAGRERSLMAPIGLNQDGEFEGLFRTLRGLIAEFVAPLAALEAFFEPGTGADVRRSMCQGWFGARYWPTAFELAFSDPLLLTMFGPDAVQHAAPGSYPAYFRQAFERGLSMPNAARNPFLQHVLLGRYLRRDAPGYIFAQKRAELTLHQAELPDVPGLDGFDLFSLSNIFDWSDDALVARWAGALKERAHPGAVVLLRQLNNTRDLRPFFEPHFEFDDRLGQSLLSMDRSLFYNRIEVARRRTEV